VYAGATAPDGEPAWLRALGDKAVPEKDADAYLARQATYDPDLWVLEIEDPKGAFVLDDPVLKL
jgi:hypothetical protein